MTVKKEAFAVFDCKNEGWTDASTLEPHLLRSGQQKAFAFYVYDSDCGRGYVAVSENPTVDANRICVEKFLIPTHFEILLFALNIEQVEMLDSELDDGDLENGIEQTIKPEEFIKNMTRIFGGMIMSIVELKTSAPASAKITYSCDGPTCHSHICGKPDMSSVGDLLDVQGVMKDEFMGHVHYCLREDTESGPMCMARDELFVGVDESAYADEDYSEMDNIQLINKLCQLRLAVHITQESEAYNNHRTLMLMGIVLEGDLDKAIKEGRIVAHDVKEGIKPYMLARCICGTQDFDKVMERPEVKLPPLMTPNYFIEKFNHDFPNEDPTDLDEVQAVMKWCGMRGHYDYYPDDPHFLCVASAKMQTVVFLTRDGEGKYTNANIGFFLTPSGVIDLFKNLVKLRFYLETRHCMETLNSVQRKSEMNTVVDHYTDVFGSALGDFLCECADFAMGASEFPMDDEDVDEEEIEGMSEEVFEKFLVEQGIAENDIMSDALLNKVIDNGDSADFSEMDDVRLTPL